MPAANTLFRLSPLALILALAGCATGTAQHATPDPTATALPAMTPANTIAVKPGLSIERWWTLFQDPALDALMDEALARNADLEAALARVREARASLQATRAAQGPFVDIQADADRSQRSTVSATPLPPGVDRRASSHAVTLAVSYEVDLWGRLSSATDAARQQLLAGEWARATVEWSLTGALAEAWFSLAAIERQIAISEAVRASRAATLDTRRQEHAAGAGSEFDLRRAEAELTGAEANLAALARSRASVERTLLLLLGRTPQEIVARPLPRRELDEGSAHAAVLPQGGAAELLSRRPDVRQAEARLAAANASIDAARAATLPSLRLTGLLGSDARALSNLFSGPAAIWSIAASAGQSLFDGGRLQAQVELEQARAGQALADYRKTVATAVADLREAYANLEHTRLAFDAQQRSVAALARARELARLGYENGALSHLDFLDAERNWYQAQLNQVTAYRDQLFGQVAAFKALGGGHAADPQITLH